MVDSATLSELWHRLEAAGRVGVDLIDSFLEAGGIPPGVCEQLFDSDLIDDLERKLEDRLLALDEEITRLEEKQQEQAEAIWSELRAGVEGAAHQAGELLEGTAWNRAPFLALGRALADAVGGPITALAGTGSPVAQEAESFDSALLEAIDEAPEYHPELEGALDLLGRADDAWSEQTLQGLCQLLRLVDARSEGDRAIGAVAALRESLLGDESLRGGLVILVQQALAGEVVGQALSRLSGDLQKDVVRAAFGESPEAFLELATTPPTASWRDHMAASIGAAGPALDGAVIEAGATSGWNRLVTAATEHQRRLRALRAAETSLERAGSDQRRRAADLLVRKMEEVEVVLRAYSSLRAGLAEVGLGAAVDLVQLEHRQRDLSPGSVKVRGAPRERVEVITGGFREPDGPVLLPATGVPRGRESGR